MSSRAAARMSARRLWARARRLLASYRRGLTDLGNRITLLLDTPYCIRNFGGTMHPSPFLTRLLQATNAHDLEQIVDCFTPDYVNRTPCHPARGFTGRDQVRRNWAAILTGVPDLVADVVAESTSGAQVWSEW